MATEKTYLVYKHGNSGDCISLGEFRASEEGRGLGEEGVCFHCDEEMELIDEVTEDGALDDPTEKMQSFIKGLSDFERATFLAMCAESIRGSWRQLNERLQIIAYIAEHGVGNALPDEEVKTARSIAERLKRKDRVRGLHPDGRSFRGDSPGQYGSMWDHLGKNMDVMEDLAPFVPNDATYNEHYFEV